MPGYEPITAVAASLKTTEETLRDFHQKGWIEAVNRKDVMFLSSDQRYRAKYILFLCDTKHLTPDQVQLVLDIQRPPYSAAEVDEILERNATAKS
jgi:hypothetical protein